MPPSVTLECASPTDFFKGELEFDLINGWDVGKGIILEGLLKSS